MKTILLTVLATILCGGKQLTQLTDQWQALLDKHVGQQGQVSYLGFAKDRQQLLDYLNGYRQLQFDKFDDSTKKALYINLYNAFMIEALLRYCREKKIDLAGKDFLKLRINRLRVEGGNIWNGNYKVAVGGLMVNLDNIEHDLIRGQARDGQLAKIKVKVLDPRIHMAVNCAALSCPRLRIEAYRPTTVEKMLEENIRAFVNDGNHLQLLKNGKIKLNKIILWYYGDFEKSGKRTAGSYLASFLRPLADNRVLAQTLKDSLNNRAKFALRFSRAIDFFYNWQVNDRRNYSR